MQATYSERLNRASAGADILERFVDAFSKTLPSPLFYHSGQQHYGFRFGAPTARHFCLLKGVRVVSAYRASIALARQGYVQEVFVLLRTLTEFSTHIEFVLLGHRPDGSVTEEVAEYVRAFFADFARNVGQGFGRIKLKQGDVHKLLGAWLDGGTDVSQTGAIDPTEKLFSNVYLSLSNYVHGRYPEIMDMYGGEPRHWHMHGMSNTPKDGETTDFIETMLVTISQSFRMMVKVLELNSLISADPALSQWYASEA